METVYSNGMKSKNNEKQWAEFLTVMAATSNPAAGASPLSLTQNYPKQHFSMINADGKRSLGGEDDGMMKTKHAKMNISQEAPLVAPSTVFPVSSLTSAASAFIQTDIMARQNQLLATQPHISFNDAHVTQQQRLSEIISEEIALLEATKKALLLRERAEAKAQRALSSAQDKAMPGPRDAAMVSSDDDESTGGARHPPSRMVALHNYWVRTRRAPTLEP